MSGHWKRTPINDHVLIQINMTIAIGVGEKFDDLPPGFTDALRAAIKTTGADIITSSICPTHRQNYLNTAREILNKASQESFKPQEPNE